MSFGKFLANVKAHAPLPARASADHVVNVVITGNHRNRAAGSGCMARLVGLLHSSFVHLGFTSYLAVSPIFDAHKVPGV